MVDVLIIPLGRLQVKGVPDDIPYARQDDTLIPARRAVGSTHTAIKHQAVFPIAFLHHRNEGQLAEDRITTIQKNLAAVRDENSLTYPRTTRSLSTS